MKEIDFRNDLLPLKNKLFRLALRITLDRPEAEDVVEDVLVKVWENRMSPEVQALQSLEAYCCTLTRNLALDRSQRRDAQYVSLDDDSSQLALSNRPDSTPLPDQRMEHDERLQWVHRLFLQLPEKQRTVLQLRDIEEHSYQEISEIMQITESDVKVSIFRARQTLKHLITQQKGNEFI